MRTCRSETCGAQVMWLRNDRTGSMAPIDLVPNDQGNITVDTRAGTYHVLTKTEKRNRSEPGLFDLDSVQPLYTNHFQTCPDAKTFYNKRCQVCHYHPCRCAATAAS